MLLQIFEIVLLVLALFNYWYSTFIWFPVWKNRKRGSAHALVLLTSTWGIIILVEIIDAANKWINNDRSLVHAIPISALIFVNSFFSVAFAKGYFRYKE